MGLDLELDLGGRLEIAVGKQTDELKDALTPRKPIINSAVGSGIMPASGELFIDLGSPASGRMWEVTALTLFGVDDNTAVANAKAALYFGDPVIPSISSLRVPALAVPSFTAIGTETLWCEAQANVVLGVTGAAAGSQISGVVQYRDWAECDIVARNGR